MPNRIVTKNKGLETCPEPECNLSSKDVEQFVEELGSYAGLFEPAFRRREQWECGQIYLKGLLGDTERKNVERMALEMGENVLDMQQFVGQSPWWKEPAVSISAMSQPTFSCPNWCGSAECAGRLKRSSNKARANWASTITKLGAGWAGIIICSWFRYTQAQKTSKSVIIDLSSLWQDGVVVTHFLP